MKRTVLCLLLLQGMITAFADSGESGWLPVLVESRQAMDTGEESAYSPWRNPIVKQGKLHSPLVEVTPFVFQERLYLLENWQKQWEHPGIPDGSMFQEDEVRIRDVEKDEILSIAQRGHGLGSALVWDGRVYVFSGDWGTEKKWHIQRIEMTSSDDLIHWTAPETILVAEEGERFFNVSVCRGEDRFYLLIETDDPQWPAFTFKYFESEDLRTWKAIPEARYGREKYVGGPAFYYFDGIFYTLYLQSLGERRYETRIARSKDLIHWQDAPEDRPFVTFDPEQPVHSLRPAEIREQNASDVELVEFGGRTLIYFTGGDQQLAGDLQWATYDGTPQALFEHFFAETSLPLPSAAQQNYQDNQLGAFVHFGPATYTQSEFLKTPNPGVFNPVALDAEQWVRTAKSFGAKHIVLTAKHHNGFCLWPTMTTDYSVRSAPWKEGRGDVVREFVDAARSQELQPGLYLSGGDYNFPCTSTPDPMGERTLRGDRNAYFAVFWEQLRELLTEYGPLAVVWFDGAYDPFGWDVADDTGRILGPSFGDALVTMVRQLQPGAVIFNGTRPDVRWSGNEQGWAHYPLWNVVPRTPPTAQEQFMRYDGDIPLWIPPYFNGWTIPEANLHTRATWFWTPDSDHTLKSVDDLLDRYDRSIGHGANLLINMTPDTRGLVPEAEVERLRAFGQALDQRFSTPLAATDSDWKWREGHALELTWPAAAPVATVILEEELASGQRVRRYRVEAQVNGAWQEIAEGESIGRKRIHRIDAVNTASLRLRVLDAGPLPRIRRFAAYGAGPES